MNEALSFWMEARGRHLRDDGASWIAHMGHLGEIVRRVGPASIVDFGCSSGYFLEALEVPAKWGFDLDAPALDRARRRGLTVTDRWEEVPEVEMITAIDVAEHMGPDDLWTWIGRWHDRLLGGGHLLLQTDNPACPVAHIDFWNDPTHRRMYGEATCRTS